MASGGLRCWPSSDSLGPTEEELQELQEEACEQFDSLGPTEEELQELQEEACEQFEKKGYEALDFDQQSGYLLLEKQKVRLGVTGGPGVGKSSFINSIRGLGPDDEGAAATGTIEITNCVKKYSHPRNKQLNMYDLPGVGTPKIPKESYVEKVKLSKYDMLIIVFRSRVSENDVWLADNAKTLGKPVLLIRSHIDVDVTNEIKRNKYKNSDNPEQVILEKMRLDAIKQMRGQGVKSKSVFLIDCRDTSMMCFDGQKLLNHAIKEFPLWKKRAFVMSLTANNKAVIEAKVMMARKKIFIQAIKAAAGGTLPIPFMGMVIDAMLFRDTVQYWRSELYISDSDIEKVANFKHLTPEVLQKTVLMHVWGQMDIDDARTTFDLRESQMVKYFIKMIPGVSTFVEYNTITRLLVKTLDELKKDALRLLDYVRNSSFSGGTGRQTEV